MWYGSWPIIKEYSMAFTLLDIDRIIAQLRRRLRLLEIQGNSGIVRTGLAADRPAAPVLSEGTTVGYYSYDTKVLSIWNVDTKVWDESGVFS